MTGCSARCWYQIFLYIFSPLPGEMNQFDYNIYIYTIPTWSLTVRPWKYNIPKGKACLPAIELLNFGGWSKHQLFAKVPRAPWDHGWVTETGLCHLGKSWKKNGSFFHGNRGDPTQKEIRPNLGGALLGSLFFVRTRCLFQGLEFFLGQYKWNYDD